MKTYQSTEALLSKIEFLKREARKLSTGNIEHLPVLPKTKLNWSLKVRPKIDGLTNILNYVPMLRQRHEDDWSWIMDLWARQMTKSSLIATDMGYIMTTLPNQRVVFCTFEDEALSVFSNEKWRESLWSESPLARQFVIGSTVGAVGYLKTKNNSSARLVTHVNKFHHVESKSANLLIFDEGQNLDLDSWVRAKESQSFTNGKFRIAGIGGWEGTEYHKWWKSTDQRIWVFNDELWREKLQFDKDGLIWDSYMLDVLAGYWKQTKQENQDRHGYFTNQYQAPWIPLLKSDCTKYHLPKDKSIQWKEEEYPQDDFIRHVKAGFVKGDKKPFIEETMLKLVDKNLSFTPSNLVNHSLGDTFGGADWGGGPKTVVWIMQCIDEQAPIFRLLFAAKLEGQSQNEQYHTVKDIFEAYDTKQNVVDGGGGIHQAEQLMNYFGPRCLRCFYVTRPGKVKPDIKEMIKLRRDNKYVIDKTYSLDTTADLIYRHHSINGKMTPRLILPGADYSNIEWIIKQFQNEETELITIGSGNQKYKRYFTSDQKLTPDDALQAANFARIAWMISQGKATGHMIGGIDDEDE